uniref:Chalcone/stilbene synthase C-terminal domain-containing protein n=1 Tax=Oryza punctata TaxID=4537 RepID=A0A0E0M5Z5_ORYPU
MHSNQSETRILIGTTSSRQCTLAAKQGKLRLQLGKLAVSCDVLSEYGNMSGTTTAFVLDELRRRRNMEEGV